MQEQPRILEATIPAVVERVRKYVARTVENVCDPTLSQCVAIRRHNGAPDKEEGQHFGAFLRVRLERRMRREGGEKGIGRTAIRDNSGQQLLLTERADVYGKRLSVRAIHTYTNSDGYGLV